MNAQVNRPPQYAIDELAYWIYPGAPEWDKDRIEAERKRLGEGAIANLPELAKNLTAEARAEAEAEREKIRREAEARHPVSVWYTGETKFSSEAPLTVPELLRTGDNPASAVTIAAYLTGEPTRYVVRSLDAVPFRRLSRWLGDPEKRDEWNVEAVRHGLLRIEKGDGQIIEPDRDAPNGPISMAWINWLDRSQRYLIDFLGADIYVLSTKGGGEGKL